MTTPPKKQLGNQGEALVTAWLRQEGWQVIAQQWRCRWGELDIVAYGPGKQPCLAFIEVKTRGRGSWDRQGRLAITRQKQRKLWRSAELFLLQHPQYSTLPCRFDVALVGRDVPPEQPALLTHGDLDTQPVLALIDYIPNAFELG